MSEAAVKYSIIYLLRLPLPVKGERVIVSVVLS